MPCNALRRKATSVYTLPAPPVWNLACLEMPANDNTFFFVCMSKINISMSAILLKGAEENFKI